MQENRPELGGGHEREGRKGYLVLTKKRWQTLVIEPGTAQAVEVMVVSVAPTRARFRLFTQVPRTIMREEIAHRNFPPKAGGLVLERDINEAIIIDPASPSPIEIRLFDTPHGEAKIGILDPLKREVAPGQTRHR